MQGMQGRDKLGRDLLGHAHISWIYMTTRNKGRVYILDNQECALIFLVLTSDCMS
jgi:hypothetical protein